MRGMKERYTMHKTSQPRLSHLISQLGEIRAYPLCHISPARQMSSIEMSGQCSPFDP